MQKTWRCTICGYLHTGDEPPLLCPLCQADASKFELVEDADEAEANLDSAPGSGLFRELRETFVPHAVSAHFPNALLPTMMLFLGLFLFSGKSSFETTFFYLLVVSVLAIPPTFGSGIWDWRKHYRGENAPIFRKKIVLAAILSVLGIIALLWRWLNPQLLVAGGWTAWLFMLLILAMLGCVTLLGHYGGMLVFAKQR